MKKNRAHPSGSGVEKFPGYLRGAPLLCALALSGHGQAALAANQPVVVTGDNVNVRSRPSLEGEVLAKLDAGTVLSSFEKVPAAKRAPGQPAAWARVQLPATVPVWVHSAYLEADQVRADRLNLRSGPGENFSVLGQLKAGEKIKVRGQKGKWVQVEPPPQVEAFVAMDYVAPVPAPAIASAPAVKLQAAPSLASTRVEPAKSSNRPVAAPTTSVAAAAPPRAAQSPVNTAASLPAANRSPAKNVPVEIAAVSTQVRARPAQVADNPVTVPAPTPSPAQSVAPAATPVLASGGTLAKTTPLPPMSAVPSTPAENAPLLAPATTPLQPPVLQAKADDNSGRDLALRAAEERQRNAHMDSVPSDSETTAASQFQLEPLPETPKNELSVGYFMTWNTSVRFKNSGGGLFPGPVAGQYDDGFVRDSSRGNIDGYTWNWGYENASQYDAPNDRLIMSQSSVVPGSTFGTSHGTDKSDMHDGIQFGYHRLLWDRPDQGARLGLEFSFAYASMDLGDRRSQSADVRLDRNAYTLGGIHPPGAPYSGSFSGPGPLILDNPVALPAQMVANGAMISSRRTLDLDMYNLRLGPKLSVDITSRLFGTASAGLALMMVDGEFRYRDTVQGGVNLEVSGHEKKFSVLPGGYVGAGLGFRLSESWAATYQVHFQYNEPYEQRMNGRSVKWNMQPSIFQTFGLSYSF
jgi:hypothetical protein